MASKALTKRKPGGQPGNISRARHSYRTFLKRRVLTRPEHRVALHLAEAMAEALMADKPNATAAEQAAIANVVTAQALVSLCLLEIGEHGAFRVNADGDRVAGAAMKDVSRFMGEVRNGLALIGVDRRSAPAATLADHLKALTAGTASAEDAIPVESSEVKK